MTSLHNKTKSNAIQIPMEQMQQLDERKALLPTQGGLVGKVRRNTFESSTGNNG